MRATTLSEYLDVYGPALVAQLDKASEPLVKAGERTINIDLLRQPFDSQWGRIEGMVASWRDGRDYAILSGETGIGKTIISMTGIHAHAGGKAYRALVVCPSHLCKKWVREINATIPGARAFIINKYSDLTHMRKYGKADGPEFYVMSDSKAKLGTSWVPACVQSYQTDDGRCSSDVIRCAACHSVIKKKITVDDDSVEVPAEVKDISKKQMKCETCKEPLYQWTHKLDRWPCADYIAKHMKGWFGYLVIDEAHCARSATSAIGNAVAQLASSIKLKVAMTGTLINGYADSLFPTLYRFDSPRMVGLDLKWNDSMEFVRRYGRIETITNYEDNGSGFSNRMSKGKQKSKSVKVKPGIVPSMYGDCMMSNTLFMGLEDLGFELPVQHEYLHGVDMGYDMASNYELIEHTLTSALADMLRCGNKAALSTMLNTLLGWPDHPHGFGEIGYRDSEDEWQHVMNVPDLDADAAREKENKLVEIVADVTNRKRQSWVYCTMTQKRDVQPGLQMLLQKEGLDCRVLRSQKVPTDKREEWIEKNAKADVIISHPALVQTGLDLFLKGSHNFCSLIWYSMGFKLDTVRQASGRARRVGQTEECELHYLYFKETMQQRAAILMSEKTKAAQAIDGNFSDNGLAGLAGSDDNAAMMLVRNLLESKAMS